MLMQSLAPSGLPMRPPNHFPKPSNPGSRIRTLSFRSLSTNQLVLKVMSTGGQFDQLADRLRRLQLDNQASSEAVEQVMEMSLEELRECRIEFGKAHMNKPFKEMVKEDRYLTWFAETYRHSQKICHMKFLRFIELHLDDVESQKNQTRPKSQAKAKAKPKASNHAAPHARDHPELPPDPWHPSSDEEIGSASWEPVAHAEEINHMNERMTEMESVLQQILSHLNPHAQPHSMA